MHLMRCLTFVAAKCNFVFSSTHIKGTLADALSRNKAPLFFSLFPTPLHRAIPDLLLNVKPDWTSRTWIKLWSTIFCTPSTQRSYKSAQTRYYSFCSNFTIQPLPLQETHLCRFASFLAKENIAHTTIKCYLSALRRLSQLPGPEDLSLPKIRERHTRRQDGAHKKTASYHGGYTSQPPIIFRGKKSGRGLLHAMGGNLHLLLRIHAFRGDDTPIGVSLRSVRSLTPSIVKLQLKASKTDPFRKGVEIILGRTALRFLRRRSPPHQITVYTENTGSTVTCGH